MKDPNADSAIANNAISVFPDLVYLTRDENGVTKAHPGKTSALSEIILNLLVMSNKKLQSE